MPPVGFEPTISAVERPQTYPIDRAATGIGSRSMYQRYYPNIRVDRLNRVSCDLWKQSNGKTSRLILHVHFYI
jgi:hypothetical protein